MCIHSMVLLHTYKYISQYISNCLQQHSLIHSEKKQKTEASMSQN